MMRSSRLHITELTLQGNMSNRIPVSHLSSQTVSMFYPYTVYLAAGVLCSTSIQFTFAAGADTHASIRSYSKAI